MTTNIRSKIYPDSVRGQFGIKLYNRETGEVVDEYTDPNVVVLDAKEAIIKAVAGDSQGFITGLKVGDDVGTGTSVDPEPADESYNESTMSVVHTYQGTFTIGYTNPTTVNFSGTISGADLMENYPNDNFKIITSAALHTNNGNVFAYKRFPQKSVSELLDISVIWKIYF